MVLFSQGSLLAIDYVYIQMRKSLYFYLGQNIASHLMLLMVGSLHKFLYLISDIDPFRLCFKSFALCGDNVGLHLLFT